MGRPFPNIGTVSTLFVSISGPIPTSPGTPIAVTAISVFVNIRKR